MGISISIKSEIDSRVLLYPMMRCFKPLGNILIVTSNKQVSRLIEGESEGDFRNFHILVDYEGATDELLEDASISTDDFDFVIYDNVGIVEQDKLLIPIGSIISEDFENEMLLLGEDHNTHIIKFGKAISNKNKVKKTKEELKAEAEEKKFNKQKSKQKADNMTDDELNELASAKFKPKKVDVSAKLKKLPNLNYLTYEDMELFESNKQFFNIDRNFIKLFYTIFQPYIGIKEPFFIKEVSRKDARSSSIKSKPSNW